MTPNTTVTLAQELIDQHDAMERLLRRWEVASESFDTRTTKGAFALAATVNDLGNETRLFLATAKNFSLVRRSTPALAPGKESMA